MSDVSDVTAATRPHLSIGEVLALLHDEFPDVTISKIRFLESQGLLDPERTPSGYRKFYDDDIARLRWILAQQRDNFLPLRVIKERLAAATTAADLDASPLEPARCRGRRPAEPLEAADRCRGPDGAVADRTPWPRPSTGGRPSGPARAAAGSSTPSDVSLSTAELAAAAGLAERDIERSSRSA